MSTDRYMHEIQDDTWRDLKWFSISSMLTMWFFRHRSLPWMTTYLLERWWRENRYSSLPHHISCRRFRSYFSSTVSLHDDAISFNQFNVEDKFVHETLDDVQGNDWDVTDPEGSDSFNAFIRICDICTSKDPESPGSTKIQSVLQEKLFCIVDDDPTISRNVTWNESSTVLYHVR